MRISLKDTPITDACLPALAKLQAIEMLRLTGTQVTDKGVASLRGHPSLQALEVRGTAVTEAEAARLKATTPGEYLRVSVGKAQ